MLTLTRKIGESIRIGDDIVVVVKEIKGKQVRLGIEAPRDVYVCREELFMKIKQANEGAVAQEPNEERVEASNALTALGRMLLSRQPNAEVRGGQEDGLTSRVSPTSTRSDDES